MIETERLILRAFREEGLTVRDVVVLVDREQGGRETLEGAGLTLHAVYTLRELVSALAGRKAVSREQEQEVLEYLGRQRPTGAAGGE